MKKNEKKWKKIILIYVISWYLIQEDCIDILLIFFTIYNKKISDGWLKKNLKF